MRYTQEWLERVERTQDLIPIGYEVIEQIESKDRRVLLAQQYSIAVMRFKHELAGGNRTFREEEDILSLIALARESCDES